MEERFGCYQRADFEDILPQRSRERGIKGSSTGIEDECVLFVSDETVHKGGDSRFVDDSEGVHSTDDTSAISALVLGAFGVREDSDHGVAESTTKAGLGDSRPSQHLVSNTLGTVSIMTNGRQKR